MNFGFTEEQEMLRATARKVLEAECPTTFVRKMMSDDTAHSEDLWKKMAGLGWLGILVPEEFGGLGGCFLDLVVVLEEMGRVLLPGPFFATALLGVPTLVTGASPEQQSDLLPKVASGDLILTLALAEAGGDYDAGGIALAARPRGRDFVLTGEKLFVPDAHVADCIIVAARTTEGGAPAEGVSLFLVDGKQPGVTVSQLSTVDMTRRHCHVALRDVTVPRARLIGELDAGWPVVRRVLDHAIAGLCTEMIGTSQAALDMAVAYAKERVQFGKPICSFQAVKHKCVDMMVAVENARSLTYYAAWAVDEGAPQAATAVPMAKAYCSDACKTVASEAIQVHGGIGFTWEHDIHLFYRRALACEGAFGSAPLHREMVARHLGL